MSILNNEEKLHLNKLINENNVEDFTEKIRSQKQSNLIKSDIKQMMFLKQKYSRLCKSNPDEFDKICVSQCQFLFNNYTDLFNKVKNDTLDLTIMDKVLTILKRIEDSEIDQHEGSYLVGKYLKELYIDSALKSKKLEQDTRRKKVPKNQHY